MATSVGQIGLDLVVNKNGFEKQMQGITGLAKKAGAALAGAFAVKKLIDFGKECIELGSNLEEVQNVVDVTFPTMAAQVDTFAKSAAMSFGLSETMAKKFTGTFGAMAKAFGFTEKQAYDMGSTLTGLSGDVASFYNISQDEAYTKLKSVFTGETETLKDLGVVMTQNALDAYAMANGYGKVTKDMSEAEKVALRYAFVQKQLSAASGDFARTSDSWANQTRILKLQLDSIKATIGQGFINLFKPIIKSVNTLLGKIMTLANAFKSFTELITGNKAKSGSGMSSLAKAAGDAGGSFTGASGAADGLAESTEGIGSAAKKAAKEIKKSMLGIDEINKLSPKDESADDGGDGAGADVDFGNLAEGETVLDKLNDKTTPLIEKFKELAGLFKAGFEVGFGDSEKKIDAIKGHLGGIQQSLKEIVTSPEVSGAAERLANEYAEYLGKVAGSAASIGISIADNLIGGTDKYLQGSKGYIQERLASIFNVQADTFHIVGDFAVALADIAGVLDSDSAKEITGHLIGIFADAGLGIYDLVTKLGRDVIDLLTRPIIENKDRIKIALENIFEPVSKVLETLHTSVKDTFSKLNQVYDDHLKPMFDSITTGVSDIVGTLLDGYNTYIAPVLDNLADKFAGVWGEHVQPVIDKMIDIFGKLADSIKKIWDETMQPFIQWCAENIMPVLAPILDAMGSLFLDVVGVICDILSGLLDTLGGIIDFITGVFTGDWELAWTGIKEIFLGIWEAIKGLFGGIIDVIKDLFSPLTDWFSEKVDSIGNVLSDGFNAAKDTVTGVFSSIGEKTKEAWETIKNSISEKLEGVKTSVSEKFGAVKETMGTVMETAKETVKEKLSIMKQAFDENGGGMKGATAAAMEGIKSCYTTGYTYINNLTNGKLGEVVNKFKDKLSQAKETVSSVLGTIKEKFQSIMDGAKNIVSGALDKIKNFFKFEWSLPKLKMPHFNVSGNFSLNPPSIPKFGIDWYAKGGVINSPTLAMMGENGKKEAVVPLERNLGWRDAITDKIMEQLPRTGSGGGQSFTLDELMDRLQPVIMEAVKLFAGLVPKPQYQADTGDIVIPIYLGNELIDEIIITAQDRRNLRTGGR